MLNGKDDGIEDLTHELANKIRGINLTYAADLTRDQYRMLVETAMALVLSNHFGGLFMSEDDDTSWEGFLQYGVDRISFIVKNLPAPE